MSVDDSEPPQYIVTAPGDEDEGNVDDDKSSTTTASTVTSTSTVIGPNKGKSQNTRSHSLQSTTSPGTSILLDQPHSSLIQQLKAQSSVNIITEKHIQKFSSTTSSTSSTTTTTATKGKFTSFLQHPDPSGGSHAATFLTAQQKHVRQFVRSTSAHSSTDSNVSGSVKTEQCIRSASQQMDDDQCLTTIEQTKGFHQSASILISKSAETIEGLKSNQGGISMRNQLTLSGGLLAPPNRKLTILSPVHAPPGLQELLKRHRSPLSPRISFPGSEAEIFP